jgi:CPA1 family monovalent cation:H+ antiporter
MRGTVTLAAALAIPMEAFGGKPFPYRDLILVCAFGVVLGTLVVQGLTLKPLLLRLRLEDDGSVEREIRLARATTLEAAVASLAQVPQAKDVPWVAERYESALQKAREALASARDQAEDEEAAVVRAAIAAQRHRLVALRNDGTIGDAALQRIEEELDRAELNWIQ